MLDWSVGRVTKRHGKSGGGGGVGIGTSMVNETVDEATVNKSILNKYLNRNSIVLIN